MCYGQTPLMIHHPDGIEQKRPPIIVMAPVILLMIMVIVNSETVRGSSRCGMVLHRQVSQSIPP